MLVSPLDWGLGHTTRCIPLIRELIIQGCEVVIACNSRQKDLLILEFPALRFVDLPGYDIRYGKNRWHTLGWLFIQGPKILTKIKQENRWIQQFLTLEPVKAIISDNRFGFFSPSKPSIFITHQLLVKTGLGTWVDAIVRRWNFRRIEKFNTCWVPDIAGKISLAGALSHPPTTPRIQTQYIGCLSRFVEEDVAYSAAGLSGPLLIILSGPEPLRSIFEQMLLTQIAHYHGPVILIRGVSGSIEIPVVPPHCVVYNHVAAAHLLPLIKAADFVISRTGYTSVMDLLLLHKKTILVPTPGQAEQEYLAQHLLHHQWAFTVAQKDFLLQTALENAIAFPYRQLPLNGQEYKAAITQLVQRIS